jgi:prophage regulatory protein
MANEFYMELNMANENTRAKRVIRLSEVKYRTGMARSTIYRRIAQGEFPKPIPLGSCRIVGWLESEIDIWLDQKIFEREH